MEKVVINLLKEVLECEDIDINTSQENCEKWDSLSYLNIVIELESEFNMSFEPEEIAEMSSVKKIIDVINSKKNNDSI